MIRSSRMPYNDNTPMPTDAPTLVSLFSGAGGLDIGLERAGFRSVIATDFNADCLASLRASQAAGIPIHSGASRCFLERTRLIEAAVQDLRPKDLRPLDVAAAWVPDLLIGGPPCQPFSSAGKMGSVQDPRGRLFEHFVRLARGLRPRTILFENVQGLVTARGPSGQPGEVLMMVKTAFEEIGYATTFALLNSADYGAAQRRIRCFMLASRHEPLPAFPNPTHGADLAGQLFPEFRPWVTLGDFFATRSAPTEFELVRPSAALAEQLADVPSGSGLKSRGIREATRPGGHWGYKQGTWIADIATPARTITAASTQDWIRESDGSLRRLTWRECAALQGFPQDWDFRGPVASKFRQIGNAVPAVFGEVLGNSLIASLNAHKRRRAQSALLPRRFTAAIDYTKREHARNGPSRTAARRRAAEAAGADLSELKGLGSDDRPLTDEPTAVAR